jgi:hypothetical protein
VVKDLESVPASDRRQENAILLAIAAVTLLIHLLTNAGFGYFRDELYFLACSRHLAFGYVDMSPLCAWILRLQSVLFGDSLFALRLFPGIAHALTVALTGVIARELGGRGWAIALSCVAAMTAMIYLALGSFYSMNVFEPLFWMGCIYLLLRIINGASPRLWLWFGVVAGFGFLNKHSFAFFAVGIVGAMVLTAQRRHFAERSIYIGGAIAAVIALPNILWQIRHDWPTLELLRNVAQSDKNVVLGPWQFITQQVLIMNPATLPLWLGGLVWLLVARDGRRYRLLAIAYLITLAEFILMHGKHYYLAPIYPMLLAAGGVAAERLFAIRFRWIKPAIAAAMVALAALLAPTILPVVSPEKTVAYMRAIGFEPPRTETAHTAALPQHFADRLDGKRWCVPSRALTRPSRLKTSGASASSARTTVRQARSTSSVLDTGLPPALSGHQNYYLWGPRDYTGEVLLILDWPNGDEPEQFRYVEDLGPVDSSPWAMPFEQRVHIYLCRDLKVPLREFWPEVKNWL